MPVMLLSFHCKILIGQAIKQGGKINTTLEIFESLLELLYDNVN